MTKTITPWPASVDPGDRYPCHAHGEWDFCSISAHEAFCEGAADRYYEQGYPGYDFDPNDPRATER